MPSNKPLILLTEDNAFIAATITDELELAGFEVAGPFARCCDAQNWLQHEDPDCAVINVRLRDGDCTALAGELLRRNIPVVVLSGFQQKSCPVPIAATVWLEKPAAPGALEAAIRRVIDGSPPSCRGQGANHSAPAPEALCPLGS